ncbi:type II toxin-antitoxin system Phd/YefM family antitoxin [Tunturiibacter psychrotolerans]|uniref:type II toxin-antitoxin system Phd/YefM family antitoxin n=1 Tax=Tunturiibacter psychrotolerans TaxID=3069686 RepID=UPI003D1A09A3
MATVSPRRNDSIVVSALSARSNFGKLLRRVDVEQRSLVIEKRGTPTAVLMNLRDYVKLAAPEPEVLKIIGQEAKQQGTNLITSRQIDQVIKSSRAQRRKS